MSCRMRFGSFIPPHHIPEEHPAVALDADMELVEWLDRLHYDEVWIGEHHSGGWELIGSPELFIAAVAHRTTSIRFGTGVSSLPYHSPYALADRIRQLEYHTRGRIMFGVGPGSLPSDAFMQGIPTARARDRMEEALGPLVDLLAGKTVNARSDWFNLQNAHLQLPSYRQGGVEIAVASQVSPTGALAAGKFGLSMLSIGATSTGGFNALSANWAIAEEAARENGNAMDRNGWRLIGPVHVAETREKARENVRFGLHRWLEYMNEAAALPLAPPPGVDPVDHMIGTGFAVIGTPDDFVAQVERLQAQSGGFGCFLVMDHHWADRVETKRSYELIARYAIPRINDLNAQRYASEAWLKGNHDLFRGEMAAAVRQKMNDYAMSKNSDLISKDVLDHFNKNK